MKILTYILVFITSIFAIVGFGWIIFLGIRFTHSQLGVIDPQIVAMLSVISIVMILCASILAGAIRTVARSGDKTTHPEKNNLYKQFIATYSELNTENRNKDSFNLEQAMCLWASDDVLKQYLRLKNTESSGYQEAEYRKQIERVLLAIRKDLGLKNLGIRPGDINKILNISQQTSKTEYHEQKKTNYQEKVGSS